MPVNSKAHNANERAAIVGRTRIKDESANDAAESRARIAAAQEQEANRVTSTSASDLPVSGEGFHIDASPGYHNPNSTQSLRLEHMAIRRRWPTTAKRRKEIMEHMSDLALSDAPHIATRAAAIMVMAERADNARLFAPGARTHSPTQPTVNVTVQVAARESAVFGEITAFRRAAEHAAKSTVPDGTIEPKQEPRQIDQPKPNGS